MRKPETRSVTFHYPPLSLCQVRKRCPCIWGHYHAWSDEHEMNKWMKVTSFWLSFSVPFFLCFPRFYMKAAFACECICLFIIFTSFTFTKYILATVIYINIHKYLPIIAGIFLDKSNHLWERKGKKCLTPNGIHQSNVHPLSLLEFGWTDLGSSYLGENLNIYIYIQIAKKENLNIYIYSDCFPTLLKYAF